MELLKCDEVANLLRCSEKTIKYYVSSRQIPFVMIGKEARFDKNSIEIWVNTRETHPTN
jgi:excisionase family DNA binding protein